MATLPHEGTHSVMYGDLTVSVGSGYRNGYLARPDQAGRWPIVVIAPDLDGLGAHEKYVARRLARKGLAVLAVELYPDTPGDSDAGLVAYNSLSDAQALRVLDETHEYLSSDDITWAHTDRIGILGLDVGGRFALITAAHRPWVGASAVAYTPLTGDEDRAFPVADMLGHLATPLLGLYGADDDLIDPETVDEAQARNTGGQWLLYESVGHGFLDEVGPNFDAASFEDAIVRLSRFFTEHLPRAEIIDLG
jgi:carboxymethylenebutenolidase